MRVIHEDMKKGEIRLQIQNLDDLWHLDNLVQPGDLVRAMTARREEQKADKIRPERMEKTRMLLGIRVEKVEFHEFTDHLRITGKIEEGPQDHGAHHTLNLSLGDDITVVKEWRDSELQRIERAIADTQKPLVSFLCMDDDEATVAQLRQYGLKELATIRAPSHGKMFPTSDGKQVYFEEILEKMRQSQLAEAVIVLGPGFAREEFMRFLKGKDPAIASKTKTYSANHVGMQGVNEALKGGLGAKIFQETRVGEETKIVEQLLEEIGKDGLYAYGPDEVEDAIEAGAVATLLVVENRLRNRDTEDLLRKVERQNGKVVVISSHHEAGKKLEGLGGFGALLRFRVD